MNMFEKLFREIYPEDINDDVFTLTGKVFPVIMRAIWDIIIP